MLKIATQEDISELLRVGTLAAGYQPYEVDHEKIGKLIDLFLMEPNEKSIILMYMEDKKCKGLLAARVEEAIYHVGKTAVEVLWWIDSSCKLEVSTQLLNAYEFWARKMKCNYILLTSAESIDADRIAKVYRRKGFKPVERSYLKEI